MTAQCDHAGAYEAVYVRRLLHRPSLEAMSKIRAYAQSAAYNNAKAASVADDASALVQYPKSSDDHSDEEVAVLMATPSRTGGAFTRFKDCTSPVERFTTSRLVAEMLRQAGQVRCRARPVPCLGMISWS